MQIRKTITVADLEEFKKLYLTEVFCLNSKDNMETLRAIVKDVNHKILADKEAMGQRRNVLVNLQALDIVQRIATMAKWHFA